MILLLDIGNTRVKWAWLEELNLVDASAAAHDTTHRNWQSEIEGDGRRPHRIVVSNVAGPAVREAVVEWAVGHFALEPEMLSAQAEACGVRNAYLKPDLLGVDRWLGLIAARRASPRATCILNAGTAFTVDALAADGRHLGGFILPGLQLMNDALVAYGAETGQPTGGAAGHPAAGPLALVAATADRSVRLLAEQSGDEPRIVLTGGDARSIAPLMARPPDLVPDLVMTGLALVATARCG